MNSRAAAENLLLSQGFQQVGNRWRKSGGRMVVWAEIVALENGRFEVVRRF